MIQLCLQRMEASTLPYSKEVHYLGNPSVGKKWEQMKFSQLEVGKMDGRATFQRWNLSHPAAVQGYEIARISQY